MKRSRLNNFLKKPSRIIIAVDRKITDKLVKIISSVSDIIIGAKIGLVTFLENGPEEIKHFISTLKEKNLYALADLKLADISHVMIKICEKLHTIGFDGIIAHAFVGRKGALEQLVKVVRKYSLDIFLVIAMSHPGAEEILNTNFEKMLSLTKTLHATGVIVPATMPYYISKAREYLGKQFYLLSPGIGAQGASPGSALKHGADAEIIGRAILNSPNPIETTRKIAKIHMCVLNERKKETHT